ncbi:hypothetical protein [Alteribacillus sp. HJP-4]
MKLINVSMNTVIADKLETAYHFRERLIGLMFRRIFREGSRVI